MLRTIVTHAPASATSTSEIGSLISPMGPPTGHDSSRHKTPESTASRPGGPRDRPVQLMASARPAGPRAWRDPVRAHPAGPEACAFGPSAPIGGAAGGPAARAPP